MDFEDYVRMQVDTGIHSSQTETMTFWSMKSPAVKKEAAAALRARIEELHRSADTRYAHYERVTQMATKGAVVIMSKEEWEKQPLAWRVGVIINRQEQAGLLGSRWTPDTPASDVVAW